MSTTTRYRRSLSSQNEVAHIFAQRSQPEGKAGNMFFEGNSIYSYGHHFKIAAFVDIKGEQVVLFNSHSYSNSTAKHKSLVLRAVNHYELFEVPILPSYAELTPSNHEDNVAYFEKEVNEAIRKASRARKYVDFHLSAAQNLVGKMKRYSYLFDVTLTTSQQDLINMFDSGELVNSERLNAIKQKEVERQYAIIAENKEKIDEWINGERSTLPKMSKIFLRRIGDNVETSWGAIVSASEARLLFNAIRNGLNVVGNTIGHYTILNIDKNGLKIGCHYLTMMEIKRFATSQNW